MVKPRRDGSIPEPKAQKIKRAPKLDAEGKVIPAVEKKPRTESRSAKIREYVAAGHTRAEAAKHFDVIYQVVFAATKGMEVKSGRKPAKEKEVAEGVEEPEATEETSEEDND